MRKWNKNIAPLLEAELNRLESGSTLHQKRAQQAVLALNRVLQDPTNNLYKKSDLEGHCAIDVGHQYRLFFFIEHEHSTVNFVWLNSEEFIHTTDGPSDPCYDQFKRLLKEKSIDKYQPPMITEDQFNQSGDLRRDEFVQFSLKNQLGTANSSASVKISEDPEIISAVAKDTRVYGINFIVAKPKRSDLREKLLGWMCACSDENQVYFTHRLKRSEFGYEESRELLFKFGFEILSENDSKEEIFIRYHR